MGLLNQEVFVCLDCESTGLDTANDRIVEIAVTRFTFEKIIQSYESLIDPECQIPQVSQDIHNISQEMIQGKPKIAEVLPTLLKMIEGHVLVGHGISFDIALIAAEAVPISSPAPKRLSALALNLQPKFNRIKF